MKVVFEDIHNTYELDFPDDATDAEIDEYIRKAYPEPDPTYAQEQKPKEEPAKPDMEVVEGFAAAGVVGASVDYRKTVEFAAGAFQGALASFVTLPKNAVFTPIAAAAEVAPEIGTEQDDINRIIFGNSIPERIQGLFSYMTFKSLPRFTREAIRLTAQNTKLDEGVFNASIDAIRWNEGIVSKYRLERPESPVGGLGYDIGSGVASIALSWGLAALGLHHGAIGTLFGTMQFSSMYEQARRADLAPEEAFQAAMISGALEGALEMVGLDIALDYLRGFQPFKRVALRVAENALQEFTQSVSSDMVSNIYAIDKKSLNEILLNASYFAAIGAITGAPVSAVYTHLENKGVLGAFRDAGMTDKEIKGLVKNIAEKSNEANKGNIEQMVSEISDTLSNSEAARTVRNNYNDEVMSKIVYKEIYDEAYEAKQKEHVAKVKAAEDAIKGSNSEIESLEDSIDTTTKYLRQDTAEKKELENDISGLKAEKDILESVAQPVVFAEDTVVDPIDTGRITEVNQLLIEKLKRLTEVEVRIAERTKTIDTFQKQRWVAEQNLNAARDNLKMVLGSKPKPKLERIVLKHEQKSTVLTPKELKSVVAANEQSMDVSLRDRLADTVRSAGEAYNEVLEVVSERIRKISPELLAFIRRTKEFNLRMLTKEWSGRVHPFLKKMSKLPKSELALFDILLKHGERDKLDLFVRQRDMYDEYMEYRIVMDEIYRRARAAGIDVEYREVFTPRMVRAAYVTEYAEKLRGTELYSAFQEAIEGIKDKTEQAEILNGMLRGYTFNKISLAKPGQFEERVVEFITAENAKYYDNSIDAISAYIMVAADAITTREFFGKGNTDLMDSIGAFVSRLVEEKGLTIEQERDLMSILTARFTDKGTYGFAQKLKNFEYAVLIGQYYSGLTQIKDLSNTLNRAGLRIGLIEWGKALFGLSEITMADVGVEQISEEFRTRSGSGKFLNMILKSNFVKFFDAVGKNSLMSAALQEFRNRIKSGKAAPEIEAMFGDKAEKVREDLLAGKKTEDVLYLAFSELSDWQPVSALEVPEKYLRMRNGKLFYALKMYSIKQLSTYKRETMNNLKTGNRRTKTEAAEALLRLVLAFLAVGIPVEMLKDFIRGKEIDDLPDYVIDNILSLVLLNRYGEGIVAVPLVTGKAIIVDAMKLIDGNLKLKNSQLIKRAPLIGDLLHTPLIGDLLHRLFKSGG